MNLDYSPQLDAFTIARLEAAARRTGLSLDGLELLGQDAQAAWGYAAAVDAGTHEAFLARVDWNALEARLRSGPAAVVRTA
jgi:hypothetical protein